MQTPEGAERSGAVRTPRGLKAKGKRLWTDMIDRMDFDGAELVLLEEACRVADRLDQLDAVINGQDQAWAHLRPAGGDEPTEYRLVIDAALGEARQQANILKQLIVTLRVPDEKTGKRPQVRGPRGAYAPSAKSGTNVSSLDRFRQAAG